MRLLLNKKQKTFVGECLSFIFRIHKCLIAGFHTKIPVTQFVFSTFLWLQTDFSSSCIFCRVSFLFVDMPCYPPHLIYTFFCGKARFNCTLTWCTWPVRAPGHIFPSTRPKSTKMHSAGGRPAPTCWHWPSVPRLLIGCSCFRNYGGECLLKKKKWNNYKKCLNIGKKTWPRWLLFPPPSVFLGGTTPPTVAACH